MKGIWPSERVNSQVDWLRTDLSGTSALTFIDKYFEQSQESKQTPDSTSFSHCVMSHLFGFLLFSLRFCILCHAFASSLTLSLLFSDCSVPFLCSRFSIYSYVSLFLLASRAHKSSSDTSLSWKDWRSRENLQFSKLNSYETI